MSEPKNKNVWQFNEYEVSVGDRGLVFKTKKTTAEVGWRHIVSAEHERRSGIRVPVLIAGIVLIVFAVLIMTPYTSMYSLIFLIAGIVLVIASIKRTRFIARIKTTAGDEYKLSGIAEDLDEFLSVVRKKVWGK